jgi:hypothetical protein
MILVKYSRNLKVFVVMLHNPTWGLQRPSWCPGTDTGRDSSLDDLLDALQNFSEASNPESLASEQGRSTYVYILFFTYQLSSRRPHEASCWQPKYFHTWLSIYGSQVCFLTPRSQSQRKIKFNKYPGKFRTEVEISSRYEWGARPGAKDGSAPI